MAAREHYKASNLAEVSIMSATEWLEVVNLTFTPAAGADYIVFWSVEMVNKTSILQDAICRVTTDGVVSALFNQETRELGTEYPAFAGFYRIVGDGLPKSISMGIQGERPDHLIAAQAAHLVAIKLGANDRYAEYLPRLAVTGGTNIWTDCASITWEPDAGDYLVYGFSLTDNYSTTAPLYGRLLFDGTGSWEASAAHAEVGTVPKNLTPTHEMWKRNVPTSGVTRTAIWQGRSHNTGSEVGWADNRLLILSLADFEASFYAEVTELLSNITTSYVTVASVTGVASSNPHLVLGSWGVSGASGSSVGETQILDGGTQISHSRQKSISTANNRGQWAGHASVQSRDAGERTWQLDLSSTGVNTSYIRPGSAIVSLDLGAETVTHNLTPSDQTAGTPLVGVPSLASKHLLNATTLGLAGPEFGTAPLKQRHALAGTGLTAGVGVLGSPAFGQRFILAATPIAAGSPQFGAPSLAPTHSLSAMDVVTGTPAVGVPTFGQRHTVAASPLQTSAPASGAPGMAQRHILGTLGVSAAAPALGLPAMMQRHVIAATGVAVDNPYLGSPSVSQSQGLAPASLQVGSPVWSSAEFSQRHALAAYGPPGSAPAIGTPSVGQSHALNGEPVTPAPTFGEALLHQLHELVANDLQVEPVLDVPSMGTRGRARRAFFVLG